MAVGSMMCLSLVLRAGSRSEGQMAVLEEKIQLIMQRFLASIFRHTPSSNFTYVVFSPAKEILAKF